MPLISFQERKVLKIEGYLTYFNLFRFNLNWGRLVPTFFAFLSFVPSSLAITPHSTDVLMTFAAI